MKGVKLVVGMLALTGATACASSSSYLDNQRAGIALAHQGRYGEAEKLLVASLKEAEKLGPDDERFGNALSSLASLDDLHELTVNCYLEPVLTQVNRSKYASKGLFR